MAQKREKTLKVESKQKKQAKKKVSPKKEGVKTVKKKAKKVKKKSEKTGIKKKNAKKSPKKKKAIQKGKGISAEKTKDKKDDASIQEGIDSCMLFDQLRDMQEKRRSKLVKKNLVDKNKESCGGLPDPLKYSLCLVFASAMIMILFFASVYAAMALTPSQKNSSTNPEEDDRFQDIVSMAVESNSSPHEKMTTSTSTTSSTTTSSSTTSTREDPVVCNPPYIRFGLGCCLDTTKSGICDSDEEPKSTTSTLSDIVRCRSDLDCGRSRVDLECRGNEATRTRISFICNQRGTLASTCEPVSVTEVVDICGADEQCYVRGDEIMCRKRQVASNFN